MALKPDLKRLILPRIFALVLPLSERASSYEQQTTRHQVSDIVVQVLDERQIDLDEDEFGELLDILMAEVAGFGPLEGLLEDERISEITVIGPKHIFITFQGERHRIEREFDDEAHLRRTIQRLLVTADECIDGENPHTSLFRADGSQVEVLMPPLTYQTTLHIFKNNRAVWTDSVQVCHNLLTSAAMEFLKYAMLAQLNIAIVGAQSLRKTLLMKALVEHIPPKARLVLIEDRPELQPSQAQVIAMRSPEAAAAPGLMRQLQVLRPDYCVVAGTGGQLLSSFIHQDMPYLIDVPAGDSDQAMQQMDAAGMTAQMAESLDLMVALEWRSGTRQVTSIGEVNPDGTLTPLWSWQQNGLRVTGHRPRCMNRLRTAGLQIPPSPAPPNARLAHST